MLSVKKQKSIKEENIESPFHTQTSEHDKVKTSDVYRGVSIVIEDNYKPIKEKICCCIS